MTVSEFLELETDLLRHCESGDPEVARQQFTRIPLKEVEVLGDDAVALYFLTKEAINKREGAYDEAVELLNALVRQES